MKTLISALGAAILAATFAACGGSSEPSDSTIVRSPPVRLRLDCGSTKAGSGDALRQFASILRRGNEREIRSVLVDRPRFFALSAQGHPRPSVGVRGDPDEAAQAVARRGGLPVRIDEFTNSEPPRRTTDFAFRGRWDGSRHMFGKAAIDCTQGKVIVFNVAVRRR